MSQMAKVWFATHADWFEESARTQIQGKVENMTDEKAVMLSTLGFRSPGTLWLLAFLIGNLGIHCFMLRDAVGGLIRIFTFDFFLIFWVMDLFTTKSRARKFNTNLIMQYL